MRTLSLFIRVLILLSTILWADPSYGHETDLHVLVFSKTAGYRHPSITDGIDMFERLAVGHGFTVRFTEDARMFVTDTLSRYDVVVFLSTTGNVLDAVQQSAFESYIRNGGGYLGIHAASDTEYDWPWYGRLVGTFFSHHPEIQDAEILVEDNLHGSTAHLPRRWKRNDEWYNFRSNPRGQVHVLASLNERSYQGGSMGYDHPLSWCHHVDGGRSWYTAMGHTSESYTEAGFVEHVYRGLLWAAGKDSSDATATVHSTYAKTVLVDNLDQPMQIEALSDTEFLVMHRNGKLVHLDSRTGTMTTVANAGIALAGENGALGMVLGNDHHMNGTVFLLHADPVIGRYSVIRSVYDAAARKLGSTDTIMRIPFDGNVCCHSGGDMVMAPDGTLFISLGDNTVPFSSNGFAPVDSLAGRAQYDAQRTSANTNSLSGKVLRIRPTATGYEIPDDNLFPPGMAGTRPEIYAMGLRNPFRMTIDPANGSLWVADVGPDAAKDDPKYGPMGYDEINHTGRAVNFGWPYFVGANRGYMFSGGRKDTALPMNTSPNNNGLVTLPPAVGAAIWYAYSPAYVSDDFGTGGRCVAVGPIPHASEGPSSRYALQPFFRTTLLAYDFVRCNLRAVILDDDRNVLKVVPVYDDKDSVGIIDITITPNGELYALGWRDKTGRTASGSLFRLTSLHNAVGPLQARITTSVTDGRLPLDVAFIGTRSTGNIARYEWDFDGDGSMDDTLPNPTHTFTKAGLYRPVLRIVDDSGNVSTATTEIVAGNTAPTIRFVSPMEGEVVGLSDRIDYRVEAIDPDALPIRDEDVVVQFSLGHDDHAHPLDLTWGPAGTLHPPDVEGHGENANIYGVVTAKVSDSSIDEAPSLSARAGIVLRPPLVQVEHADILNGIVLEECMDVGGGQNAGFIDQNDYFAISPLNLHGVMAVDVRYATVTGGYIDIHADNLDGERLARIDLTDVTGGYQNWRTVRTAIPRTSTTHSYFFVATSDRGDQGLFNINWLRFVKDGDAASNPEPEDSRGSFDVYPNPASSVLHLSSLTGAPESSAYTLIDMMGRIVGEGWTSSPIDVSRLPVGVYRIQVRTFRKTLSASVIVVH